MTTDKNNAGILELPKVVFGTSGLGNLYTALPQNIKKEIVEACINHSDGVVVFDSAGKYGAGLALESLGKCLNELGVNRDKIMISNKLGWFRTPLTTPEPTFEKGVWVDLEYDAVQKISYDGIIQCFEQGNELLGGYVPAMVSVHDPDEYLAGAASADDERKRYNDILEAYRALADLKMSGKATSIGVGAKDWRIVSRIVNDVKLDWVMIANSMTIKSHPVELLKFIAKLESEHIPVIKSAVFHSGFLTGGSFYDYKLVEQTNPEHDALFKWRRDFFQLCSAYNIKPAAACVQFALKVPGVKSVALNTTDPNRVKQNIDMAHIAIPEGFWIEAVEQGLIDNYMVIA